MSGPIVSGSIVSGPIVRFAPSPTGLLHVGNIRAALFNWLYVRRHGGRFILRLDDTDRQRSKPEYEAAIERDLSWLGLGWDAKERQSDRLAHYDQARDRLIGSGRLYPCYETPEELEFKRKRLLAQGRPPVYDRAALKLDEAARKKFEDEGRRPALALQARFGRGALGRSGARTPARRRGKPERSSAGARRWLLSLQFHLGRGRHRLRHHPGDPRRGPRHQHRRTDPDVPCPRWRRAGLRALAAPGRRGGRRPQQADRIAVDRRSARARHRGVGDRCLAGAAGHRRFRRASHLARRAGRGRRLRTCRTSGGAFLGGRVAAAQCPDPAHDALHGRARAAGRQCGRGAMVRRARQSRQARGRERLGGGRARADHACDGGRVVPQRAAQALPGEPWNEGTWKTWTSALSVASGRKGRALFHPLRLALTARETGPEMAKLLPLIGRAKAVARLTGQAA